MQKLDEKISTSIQQIGAPLLPFWGMASRYGLYTYATAVLVIAYYISDKQRILDVILPVVFTMLFTLLLQALIRRPRPKAFRTNYDLWLSTFSFPSAHSSTSFAFATSLSLLFFASSLEYIWAYVAAFFILAIIIALSRIMVGVHYTFDVVVGSLLGILISVSFNAINLI